jgi:AcrR family transcriptional regulator
MASLPRRSISSRRAATVDRIFAEATTLLDEVGHDRLSMRMVAQRAGVSTATAYTYFASKDHLFAELFWRLLETADVRRPGGETPTSRLQEVVRDLVGLVSIAPALVEAVNRSMLSRDAEVERLRLQIGMHWVELFREAIGPEAEVGGEVLMTLSFVVSGALLQAGIGIVSYEQLADQLAVAVELIVDGRRDDPPG